MDVEIVEKLRKKNLNLEKMSKHVFYIISIIILVFVCVVDYMRINMLQKEIVEANKLIDEKIVAIERKLDACIYKKDAQMLLMNKHHGNLRVHELLADSCYNDCLKYRQKYGKEETE